MYQHIRILTAAGSIFCLLAVICFGHVQCEGELDSLCENQPVALTRISQVRQLIRDSKSIEGGKCDNYKDSLDKLDDVLIKVEEAQLCNLDLVKKISEYHHAFIDSSNNKKPQNIPDSLRRFFIALCFQINAGCKSTLIADLEFDTKGVITDSDYDTTEFLKKNDIKLFEYDSVVNDFDDILLLNDFDDDKEEERKDETIMIRVKTTPEIRLLISTCNNKFKPFYDKLILPLVKLSNLGYNYQGQMMERELEELRRNELVHRWYTIVQICEALRTIDIIEDENNDESTEDHDKVKMTFIEPDRAKYLRANHVKTVQEEAEAESKIVYEPKYRQREDGLWIYGQEDIDELVAKYKSSRTVADRIKVRRWRMLAAKVIDLIRRSEFRMALEKLRNGLGFFKNLDKEIVIEAMSPDMDKVVVKEEISTGTATRVKRELLMSGRGYMGAVHRHHPLPKRTTLATRPVDESKFTTKVSRFASKFLPRKMDMFMMMLAFAGILLLVIAIFCG